DAAIDDVLLGNRTQFEKTPVLLLRAEPHHVFDPRPVVPAAIENDDLARSREVVHVSLHVHLRLLTIRGSRQRDDAEHPWTDALSQGSNGAAFTGGVTALKKNDRSETFVLHPVL